MRYGTFIGCAIALAVSGQTTGATHYVSMEGSNQPPYLTLETAATAIPLAMEVAESGDTVFVSAGFWVQQFFAVPGAVTLRGEGRDLTFIDLVPWSDDDSTLYPEDGAVVEDVTVQGTGDFALWGAGAATLSRCNLGLVALRGEHAPLFLDCIFYAGVESRDGAPLFVGCTIFGEVHCYDASRPLFDRCRFIKTDSVRCAGTSFAAFLRCEGLHVSAYQGATAFVVGSLGCTGSASQAGNLTICSSTVQWASSHADSRVLLENCVVQRHRSPALYLDSGATMELRGCTVAGNEIGVVFQGTAPPLSLSLQNTILAGNEVDFAGTTDVVHCSYSLVPPELVGTGPGNISGDPRFVNAEQAHFRLSPDSPCIDAGLNDPKLRETDVAGMHRIMFGGKSLTVDMGAYEYYINDLGAGPGADETTLTWSSVAGKSYSLFHSSDLLTWHLVDVTVPSAGDTTTSWTDDGSKTGGIAPLLAPRRFYRILENP